jgi:prolyl-tRNA editing enzyme YbaK/EbsC (Cys-tRNA(Pro) deacylase)
MAISKKLLSYLEKNNYKYELIEHKTTYTAYDTARTTQKQEKKVKPEEIVKALVVKMDRDYALALVPASKRLDKKKLLKIINAAKKKNKGKPYKSLDLSKEAWMKKNIPGRVGATSPFHELLKLNIYIDAVLTKQKNIYVGSGEYEYSIKLSGNQYMKLEKPFKGIFSAKK